MGVRTLKIGDSLILYNWFDLKNHHSKDVNFKFSLNSQAVWIYKAILYVAVAYTYILLCKFNYGYLNQACFH